MRTFIIGVLIAGVVGVFQMLTEFDAGAITDWRGWALGLVGGFIRPVAIYVVANAGRLMEYLGEK